MQINWNNCFLCLNDLGCHNDPLDEKCLKTLKRTTSATVLLLNYLLDTKFTRSSEVLENVKQLVCSDFGAGQRLRVCEKCEVDVVLVGELHQQLEVVQMRLVEVLKDVRKTVINSSDGNVGGFGVKIFEEWLVAQENSGKWAKELDQQKRVLEGVKSFQKAVLASGKDLAIDLY